MALTEEQLKEIALAEWMHCEHFAERNFAFEFAKRLIAALPKPEAFEIDWPEYHDEAMGCGLEDRNITDRYEAMRHGWECAIERVADRLPETFYTEAPIAPPASEQKPETFQSRVEPWLLACFGEEISNDKEERNHRFLEESLELVQATGCTASEAHQLVDYVFGRPVGEPKQEVGGVMVTLAALCRANALDMHANGETELARIWTKVENIRAKQATKPRHSPLPEAAAPQPDYKAQRDALLEASKQLLIAVKHLRPCPGTVATMEAAIASVKGGA